MSSQEKIFEEVRTIVSDQLCVESSQVKPESNFTTELGADSLDVVELIMSFEEAFDIQIPDAAAMEIATVQDAVDFIVEKKELDA